FHVYRDHITVCQRCDRTSLRRFRHDMPDHETARCPGEPAIGDQGDALAEPGALKSAGYQLHLTHPRASLGPFVTKYHHVIWPDAAPLDRFESIFLSFEYPRGPAVHALCLAGDFHDAATWG